MIQHHQRRAAQLPAHELGPHSAYKAPSRLTIDSRPELAQPLRIDTRTEDYKHRAAVLPPPPQHPISHAPPPPSQVHAATMHAPRQVRLYWNTPMW